MTMERHSTYSIQRTLEESDSPKQERHLQQMQMQLERKQQTEKFQYVPLEQQTEANETILKEQKKAAQKIEKEAKALLEMFYDVQTLVSLQQVPIDAILDELKGTHKSVEKANAHLLIAEEKQKWRCILM